MSDGYFAGFPVPLRADNFDTELEPPAGDAPAEHWDLWRDALEDVAHRHICEAFDCLRLRHGSDDLAASEMREMAGDVILVVDARPARTSRKKKIPAALRWEVFKRDGFTCLHCGTQDGLAADHVVPESKGGPTTLDNLQTLCRSCNSRKGVRMPEVTT